ncbi:MAG TPA: hypothetical protein VH392_04950 [Sphingomicrobium sp.]|jgi:hypothetical protein
MNRSALLLLVPLLAGCNVHPKNPSGQEDDNVSIKADDSGHIEFNLPIAEGKLKVPTAMMHNGDFDIDGVKLMPGSKVNGFNLEAHDKGAVVDLAFVSPESPDDVRSYYMDQFSKQGVKAELAGDAVRGTTKDGSPFAIHVGPAPSGSQGKIEIQDKD